MRQVLDFDLSGVTLRLEDVPPASAERLSTEWCVYASSEVSSPFLRIGIRSDRSEPPGSSFEPKKMLSRFDGAQAEFELPEGRASVHRDGQGTIDLAQGLGSREFFTLMNLVRASLAWCLPSRGAGLVHAAGLVLDGRGFVLVGAESSGKSTWARLGEEQGAIVLSDDLVLLDATTDGHALLGAPFRSTHKTIFRKGRWPLTAVLFPDHGPSPRLSSVPAILSKARIAANLTFVADAVQSDDRVAGLIDRLATRTPCAQLTFAPDPSFVDTLRAWPGPA
jgi:hypothetical protein